MDVSSKAVCYCNLVAMVGTGPNKPVQSQNLLVRACRLVILAVQSDERMNQNQKLSSSLFNYSDELLTLQIQSGFNREK